MRLTVRVTPRASSNAVLRFEDSVLCLRLTAPPVEGAANMACCIYVAGLLGLRPASVTVGHGHKSRLKVLNIEGLTEDEVRARLQRLVPTS